MFAVLVRPKYLLLFQQYSLFC